MSMNLRAQITAVANDLLKTMIKSFGKINEPGFEYKEKYDKFQPYTIDTVCARLTENLEQNYLEAVFQHDFVHIFLEENGFRFLLGDVDQYNDLKPSEKIIWYKSVRTIASFLSIINATGEQLSSFEDIARSAKQNMTQNLHTKSPLDNMTDIFRNQNMRNMMKNAVPNANVMAQLIKRAGPLMDCMGATSTQNTTLPDEIDLNEDVIRIHKEKIQKLKEEETKTSPLPTEPSTETSIECPKKIQEECMQEESEKASDLLKDIMGAAKAGGKKNPSETMKGLAKMLGKFTENQDDMNQLFSSVTEALDRKTGPVDLGSMQEKFRKQLFQNGKSKETENFLFQVPTSKVVNIEVVEEKTPSVSEEQPSQSQPEEELKTAESIPPFNIDMSNFSELFKNLDMSQILQFPGLQNLQNMEQHAEVVEPNIDSSVSISTKDSTPDQVD